VTDDAELLRSSVDDPALFETIFERHYDAILRYARRRVGHEIGEDIAARTFVIALERRATYDAKRPSALPWLYGIATNLIRHHYRDERIHLAALARLPLDPEAEDVEDPARLDAERLRPALVSALAHLPQRDREAFVLFAVVELTYDETARALDIPIGTVRSRIHRARQRLREHIRPHVASMSESPTANEDT